MTFRPMPLLTVLSIVSLVILIWLGSWQYERYSDKMAAPAVLAEIEAAETINVDIDRTVPGEVQQVYGFADSEPIWRRYAPGRVSGTEIPVLVMIEATGGPAPVTVEISRLPAAVSFQGILAEKQRSKSGFNANDRPELNQWYSLSPQEMWENLGLEGMPLIAEPVIITVRDAANLERSRETVNPYAYSKPLDPLPPERHFGYALTWWGMALGLIGVYVALHRARGRLKF